MGYVIIWRYRVRAEHLAEFEEAYGPHGDWASWFSGAGGYQRTELLRTGKPRTYVTLDYWESEAHYRQFAEANADDYRRIDARFAAWTESEELVGAGETLA